MLIAAFAICLSSLPAPTLAAEGRYFSVEVVEINDQELVVGGAIRYGDGDLNDVWVEDPPGDARLPGVGLDLGFAQMQPIPQWGAIGFGLVFWDGNADRPVTPPNSYSWPIAAGGTWNKWLGAGAPGTGSPPETTWWQRICTSESSVVPECETELPSFIINDGVFWLVPIGEEGIPAGSTLQLGPANGGVISSFAWPLTNVSGQPLFADTIASFPEYRIPGLVSYGITPAGTPDNLVDYTESSTLDTTNALLMPYADVIPAPESPGDYDLHARSCWGPPAALICVHDTASFSI